MVFKKMNFFTDLFVRISHNPILFHSFASQHNSFGVSYDVCKCKNGFYLLEVRRWRVFLFFEKYSYKCAFVENLTDCINYIDHCILFLQRRYGSFYDVYSLVPLTIALDHLHIKE